MIRKIAASVKEIIDPEENSGSGVGIAPIGHYVTITTPQKIDIKISMTVDIARKCVGNAIAALSKR
jgi:hypothetical protein